MHIKLHITQVTVPNPRNPAEMQIIPLQRIKPSLHPLALVGFAPSHGGEHEYCELTYAAQAGTYRCAELFADVLAALEGCGEPRSSHNLVIRVPLTLEIAKAAQRPQSFPIPHGALGTVGGIHENKQEPIPAPTWDDAVMGESIPASERRKPVLGDLRLHEYGGYWGVEIFAKITDIDVEREGWTGAGVPPELRGRFGEKAEAIKAVKVAGYARRLIVE